MTIVAAFTAGDSDNLMVGRNGVFYDRKGRDWDATITKIIDNPISIRQAFWSPYKKFVRADRGAGRQARRRRPTRRRTPRSATAATATADDGRLGQPPEAKKIDIGTVAALGVAIGGIGTFVAR